MHQLHRTKDRELQHSATVQYMSVLLASTQRHYTVHAFTLIIFPIYTRINTKLSSLFDH